MCFKRQRPEGALFFLSAPLLACALLLGILFAAAPARAVDVMPYIGIIDVTPISGCCKHVEATEGFGVLARVPKVNKIIGDAEIVGYSDFKFSEASIAKYFYIYGAPPQVDPLSSADTTIVRLATWSATMSYGLGFFTHNTKTTRFDLPALVAGLQAVSRTIVGYSINDKWSVNGILELGLAYSIDENDFNIGGGLGFSYQF